jgi:hypothetical protein
MPGNSNRASTFPRAGVFTRTVKLEAHYRLVCPCTVWEDEAWLKNHNRPLGESAAADKQPQQDEEEE